MFVAVNNLSSVAHLNTPHKIVCMYGFEKELGIWFLIVLPINGYPWYLLQNGYPWCKKWLRLCFHVDASLSEFEKPTMTTNIQFDFIYRNWFCKIEYKVINVWMCSCKKRIEQ